MQIDLRTFCQFLLLLSLWFSPFSIVNAQTSAQGPHMQVSLVTEYQQFKAGINWIGIHFQPDDQWHTYWQNPGDSGEAPAISWSTPEGVSAGDIIWPIPTPIPVAHLVNYGYDGANLLMVPIELTNDYVETNQTVSISVDVSWLVCKEDCIPGWATLSNELRVSASPIKTSDAVLFEKTRHKLPNNTLLNAIHEFTEQHILVSLTPPSQGEWSLLPLAPGTVTHSASQQQISNQQDITLVLEKSDYFSSNDAPLQFLLTDGDVGYYVDSQFNHLPLDSASQATTTPLIVTLLMAFLGGLILNLMPCVLPVLSIKALSLQQSSKSTFTKFGFLLGVLASFCAFAIVIITLQQTGQAVGWGFQMQSPWVVALLAFLFVYIALTLMDVAPAGQRLSGIGQQFVEGQGFGSQFATGVLAVIVASPCTAPFMAAALGVALVSEPVITLSIFISLGLGFALPLTLLFWLPALTRWIPKPGGWMQTFRQFLAFPMLATVVWLVWVYLNQTNSLALLWLLSSLLLFSLAIWWTSKSRTFVSSAASIVLVAVSLWLPIDVATNHREPESPVAINAFSQAKLSSLKSENQVVLVNMTADWCITCKVNEQVAFNSNEFDDAIRQPNVHYLVGDWTNKNDQILSYLNQYKRSGVPLYVVYAGDRSYQVLPQILTTQIVTDAIENALGDIQNEG